MSNKINILTLVYSINFQDADEGDCYAGEGRKILSIHRTLTHPTIIKSKFDDIFCQAEKETTIFPVQKFNLLIKERFGFTLHDISDGYDFKLIIETFDVEE